MSLVDEYEQGPSEARARFVQASPLRDALGQPWPVDAGRMNRSIDSRSDLYSVGVTLHEMATGALPVARWARPGPDRLGLQLVRDLAEQLCGTLSVTRESDTTFTTEFDDAASRA